MGARFEDKAVVVTGAAGAIAAAAVEQFAREGAMVLAVDLEASPLEAALAEIDGEVAWVAADVTREEEVADFLGQAVERFGGLDVLFNNAGIEGVVASIEDYPSDVFDRVIAVNVNGVFYGIKHAVVGLTRSAAAAQAGAGIRVNAVCPAPIETRMMRSIESAISHNDPGEAKERFLARIPAGRYGEPAEVAALVAFLASDEASSISGSLYTIDGGMTPF